MDEEIFPAHIRYEDEKAIIQTVLEHLRGTEELAVFFAAPFQAEKDASLAALSHDLGKACEAFKTHILHPESHMRVDHSTFGAQTVKDNFPVSFAVAGHHGGLPDGGNLKTATGDDSTLAGRLKRKGLPDCSAWKRWLTLPPGGAPDFCKNADPLTWQFYIRMLFSCLVDADYLDTEHFMNPEIVRGSKWDLKELEARLRAKTDEFYPPKGALNEMRCRVLDACRSAGEGPKGLYTLTVPTGGGKTLASLTFALRHAVTHGMDRVIYVIPYTSIIDQTADTFRKVLGEEAVLEHHSGIVYDDTEEDRKLALAAENWDMPIIVTTAVQFFDSLYANRSSKCRKLHNLANSVIVFDEAQMLPLPYLKPCVFAIAELIRHYGATALLCTATQPALDNYFQDYGLEITEICPDRDRMFSAFRRTSFEQLGRITTEELDARLREFPQVLCVVNLRKTASDLSRLLPEEGRYCLTTLLCPADRKRLLKEIRGRLKDGLPCRVVSTSLIEAGVDVDFPRAFRELAGLDSILQTAGRCNREGKNPPEESLVSVFSLSEKVLPMIRQNVDSTKRTVKKYADLDLPEAVSEYFLFLRRLKGSEALDQQHILDAFCRGIHGCMFPFAQIADMFHLIDSPTKTVYLITEESKELISQLRSGQFSRNLFRKLGQFGVNVYPNHFQALQDSGFVTILSSGDGILEDSALYDPAFGLRVNAEPDIDRYIL